MRLAYLLLAAAPLAAQSPAVLAGLATGSYFPLGVGDRWVYRIDDRLGTASYQTWRIDRIEEVRGVPYSVMAIEGPGAVFGQYWFRAEGDSVYALSGNGEQLFLDASGEPASQAELQVTGRGSAATGLGAFPDAVNYRNLKPLVLETGTLARGVGLVSSVATLLTGSSGGFLQGRTLVEAHVGGIPFSLAAPSVQLSLESLDLDVSGRTVTNCAVPCYFVACGFVQGADPPGTYKPCARARVALNNWPAGLSRRVRLRLSAPSGEPAFEQSADLTASAAEAVLFLQIPLYSAPNQGLPPGMYSLSAEAADGSGKAAVAVKLR